MRILVTRLALLAFCPMLLHACREPTQVTIRLTTDAECGGDGFREAALTVASQAKLSGSKPTAMTGACDPGDTQADIGSIVVVPSEDDDDVFAVRVVAGIGVPAESCPAPDYVLGPEDTAAGRGCIVARRSMAFLPQTKLELSILLRQTCLNIVCSTSSTCVDGICISADVDPETCAEAGGCTERDLVEGAGGGTVVGGAGGVGGVSSVGGAGGAAAGGTGAGATGAGGTGAGGTGAGGTGAGGTGAGGTGAGGTGAGGTGAGGTGAGGTGAGGTGAGGTGAGGTGAGGTGAGGTGAGGTGGAGGAGTATGAAVDDPGDGSDF